MTFEHTRTAQSALNNMRNNQPTSGSQYVELSHVYRRYTAIILHEETSEKRQEKRQNDEHYLHIYTSRELLSEGSFQRPENVTGSLTVSRPRVNDILIISKPGRRPNIPSRSSSSKLIILVKSNYVRPFIISRINVITIMYTIFEVFVRPIISSILSG